MARMTCCITSMRRKRGWRWHRSVAKKKGNSTHRDTQDTQSTDLLGNYLIVIIIIIIINVTYFIFGTFLWDAYVKFIFNGIVFFLRFANSKIQDCYFSKHLTHWASILYFGMVGIPCFLWGMIRGITSSKPPKIDPHTKAAG